MNSRQCYRLFTKMWLIVLCGSAFAIAKASFAAGSKPVAADSQAVRNAEFLEERIRYGGTLYTNAELDSYLQSIVDKLNCVLPKALPYESVRVSTQLRWQPEISLLSNGALYVSSGLLARLEDEAQVAAVICWHIVRQGVHAIRTRDNPSNQARRKFNPSQEADADRITLEVMLVSGYPAQSAADAFARLDSTLRAEGRTFEVELGTAKWLQTRRDRLLKATDSRSSATPMQKDNGRVRYLPYLRQLALELAANDIDQFQGAAVVVLDRYESELGPDGKSRLLQAEWIRRNLQSATDDEQVLAMYLDASRYPDALAITFKELGFLYRRRAATSESISAFKEYLNRSPDAVDAAIVRTYIEKKQ